MTLKRQAALLERYNRWDESRSVGDSIASALARVGVPPQKIEAALENAIMRLILDLDGAPPSDLIRSLKLRHLVEGFECVGLSDKRLGLIAFDVIEHASSATNPGNLVVEDRPRELVFGAFSLEKTRPVERLLDYARSCMSERDALDAVITSALRYASIYAKTRHIGPPQRVYDLFHEWGVRNEGFASPFNARLLGKPHSGFFSAFPLEDSPFGSRGSFFRAEHRSFDGAWCIDPPFLTETMRRTDSIIETWRRDGWDPGVILIVPSSYDVQTAVDETVELKAHKHHYEGLDGLSHPLPTAVSIHRIGDIPGWDADAVAEGYLEGSESHVA